MDYKKFILIIVIILLIYIIYTLFKKNNSTTTMNNAQNEVVILAKNVDSTQSNSVNYGISIWFYVENWDYKYGQMKPLISRGLNYNPSSVNCPSVCRDTSGCCIDGTASANSKCTQGDVIYGCTDYILQTFINDLSNNNTNIPPCPLILLGESINNLYILQSIVKDTSNTSMDTLTNWTITTPNSFEYDISVTLVENFPIQKWINLTISFYGRTLDIYLDGKLVKTTVLPNIVYSKNVSTYDVLITPNGGFDGLTSSFKYYPTSLNPTQAWDIYKTGYSNSMFGGLLNRYKIKFSLMEGDIEDQSFEI